MERNVNMYPKTIGEELKCQVEYKKKQDKKFNYSELSRQIRNQLIQELGFERKDDDDNASTRPAMINELFDIGTKECTPKYMYLFMAFKSLGIIKDDIVILQMLNNYEIIPKKEVDKNNLEDMQKDKDLVNFRNQYTNAIVYKGINLCTKCKNEKIHCENAEKCINIKIWEKLKTFSVTEQINYLYSLGLPTTFKNAPVLYTISIQTLKNILENLNLLELKQRVQNIENKYKNKTGYNNKSYEKEINHLKEVIKIKKKNIKYYKTLTPSITNGKKEEILYNIEREQQKLNSCQKKYENLMKKNYVKNKEYDKNMLKKEIEMLLYCKN